MSTKVRRPGFTLIEVLVSVAMIAILAALVLPMLSGGGPSFNIRCMNELRQAALASDIYAQDSNNQFPNLDGKPGNDGPVALMLLTNYVKATNAFICPYVAKQREKDRPWYKKKFIPEYNRAFFESNGNDYAYYDGLQPSTNSNAILADRFAWTKRSAVDKKQLNHPNERINVGFVDGHVESAKTHTVFGTNMTPPWSARQDPLRRP